jgi:23S rRNA (uridine2552-2'-O)-methyltransferase
MGGSNNPYKRADRFTKKARESGFMARSVYKLEDVQRRHRVLSPGQKVVDLGCFPGSWTQYALQMVGKNGVVVGVDLEEPKLDKGVFIVCSVYDVQASALEEALGGKADVVLSDMAPRTVGITFSDHVRQIELASRALELAVATLVPGGAFIVKVFDGEEVPAFQTAMRSRFGKVKRIRPEAVRKSSREFFLLGMNFKG